MRGLFKFQCLFPQLFRISSSVIFIISENSIDLYFLLQNYLITFKKVSKTCISISLVDLSSLTCTPISEVK